ncbi:MAG TPA: VOC family protein [Solirubrobacteraceae bacterium]|nr:VOC family protein [Solirubrobacteraceae bacterium]
MGMRTSYAPGTFSWVDLATDDIDTARSFYAAVLGWEVEDAGAGGTTYSLCRRDGDLVAALYEPGDRPVPPGWTSHVTVGDADATAARASELGGAVIEPPTDVPGAGRTALLRDPQGAVFAIWQPRARIGAERVNDAGCLCMNELVTPDLDAARPFYEALFGWTVDGAGGSGAGPTMVFNRGNINAAMFTAPDGVPPHWRACFTVESAGAALGRIRDHGGEQLLAPADIGHGSIAMARDPQGAVFTIFAGETHP